MKTNEVIPCFVKYIPEQLEPGKIYISDEYKVAVHLCACGCGTIINRYSKYGRERRYVLGHNFN